MRYIMYGAGAIGGVIGADLHQAGHDVVLIARGKHLEAIQQNGLTVLTPEGSTTCPIPAVGHPSEITYREGDVVFLCMKSQDSIPAMDALRAAAGDAIPVVCTQNGVANERMALRRFQNVYAMVVMLPATHLEPGIVQADSAPMHGILDTARYPSGVDDVVRTITADLDAARYSARPDPAVMRFKYTKLLMNLNNGLQAAVGPAADAGALLKAARAEAIACYHAAGIDFAPDEEFLARRGDIIRLQPVAGGQRGGSSSWQSVQRGTGSIEADWLNGEIVLLGRLHGVPTPVNHTIQQAANHAAAAGLPGPYTVPELEAAIAGTAPLRSLRP